MNRTGGIGSTRADGPGSDTEPGPVPVGVKGALLSTSVHGDTGDMPSSEHVVFGVSGAMASTRPGATSEDEELGRASSIAAGLDEASTIAAGTREDEEELFDTGSAFNTSSYLSAPCENKTPYGPHGRIGAHGSPHGPR
jgi:hypothetical protein